MDGGGERESTKHEVDTEYHCHDFDWEDLRADVEANTSFSYHLSPFPANTASPPPPSSEAWRSFHRRHASGKFFKEHELDHIGRGFEFVGLVQYCILDLGNDCTSWRSPPEGDRLKINCDGAYSEETGNGGWGFTIRDREGNFRGSGAGCIAHATSAAMAEALACQEAVYAAASWGMGSLQLETDAQNLVKAMQERRYLLKEFPDLLNSKECAKVLEVGCGNGSTVVSILRCCPSITVYACDCSEDILQKANEIVCNTQGVDAKDRFHPFLLDVSRESFPDWLFCYLCQSSGAKAADPLLDSGHHNIRKEQPIWLKENQCCIHGIDFITMIFTLSAIPYDIMSATLQRCVSVLKPGGLVLFRDYGIYDMTMLRFLPHQRVGFREYIRADGTFSYYFSLDTVRELFDAAGLLELELEYCCVRSVNRKNGKSMQRVWVHGKFQKPTI